MIQADASARFAPVKEESGQSQFALLKRRSLALVPSFGAPCAPPNSTYGSSTARLFVSAPEVFTLTLHHFHPLPLHRLADVPRPSASVHAKIHHFPDAEVRKKRSSTRLQPAQLSGDLRLGLTETSSPASRSGRLGALRADKREAVCNRQSVALPKGAPQQPPAHCIWSVTPALKGDIARASLRKTVFPGIRGIT